MKRGNSSRATIEMQALPPANTLYCRSPSNSLSSSDGSEQQQGLGDIVDTRIFMNSWAGIGEFPNIGEDIKNVIEPLGSPEETKEVS